jgi:hypothetical protein
VFHNTTQRQRKSNSRSLAPRPRTGLEASYEIELVRDPDLAEKMPGTTLAPPREGHGAPAALRFAGLCRRRRSVGRARREMIRVARSGHFASKATGASHESVLQGILESLPDKTACLHWPGMPCTLRRAVSWKTRRNTFSDSRAERERRDDGGPLPERLGRRARGRPADQHGARLCDRRPRARL